MLSNRLPGGSGLHLVRTAVDAKLMARSGLDELNLRRVRRAYRERWNRASFAEKRGLIDGGITDRYGFVVDVLKSVWQPETWDLWLRYLEHSDRDIDEMIAGEYPISPYIIRLFSALLGVKVDFLTLGAWPSGDLMGPNIDAYPAAGLTHA